MSAFYNVESLKTISKKEVPATMRLARIIFKKDRKTGIEKDSKGLWVSEISSSLLTLISNDSRGAEFLEAQLGVRMQIPAQRRQLRVVLRNVRKRPATGLQAWALHQWPPALPTRSRGSTAKYNRSTTRLITTKISAIRHR